MILVIDMSMDSPICDYFVIATASNERLLLALKDHVEEAVIKKGIFVKNIEGRKNSKWILMDYGDIIVHLFDPEERKNYGIENYGLINHELTFQLRIFYNVLRKFCLLL